MTSSDKFIALNKTFIFSAYRAKAETAFINSLSHPVLDYVGTKVSVEMQTPKLLWLKKNQPDLWSQTQDFFDLADFLVPFKSIDNKDQACVIQATRAEVKSLEFGSSLTLTCDHRCKHL